MSYKLKREELEHNGSKILVVWDNERGGIFPHHEIKRSGDDCITISLNHNFMYGGEEVELLHEGLGIFVKEYKDKKEKEKIAVEEAMKEAKKLGLSYKEYIFKNYKSA